MKKLLYSEHYPPPHDYPRCPKCAAKRFPCARCAERRRQQLVAASKAELGKLKDQITVMEQKYGPAK